jgi:integrase/recombinase XerD
MSAKRSAMRKIKEVLRLKFDAKLSHERIAATHLLESGVEVNVIRGWPGHVSLDTTNRYAELMLRAKTEALRNCELGSDTSAGGRHRAVWKDDKSLLHWLSSL